MTFGQSRGLAVTTALLGVAMLVTTFAFAQLPESLAAKACGVDSLMIQFELVQRPEALGQLFGRPGAECHDLRIAAMNAQNLFDIRVYIPVYAAFMGLAAWFLAGRITARLPLAALAAALVTALADLWETTTLLDLARLSDAPLAFETPDTLQPPLAILEVASRLKFAGIAAHAGLIAAICLTAPRQRWLVGSLVLAAIPGVAALFVLGPAQPLAQLVFAAGLLLAWIPVMLAAGWAGVRPTPAAVPVGA